MSTAIEAPDAGQYAAQYELLRAQVIGTPPQRDLGRAVSPPRGMGLALLLREGMPGWLKALQWLLPTTVAVPSEAGVTAARPGLADPTTGMALPMGLASTQLHDITILLASLVLSTRHLHGSSSNEGGYRLCP